MCCVLIFPHRPADRPPSFPLAHLRRRKARRANKPKPTPQPISTPPVPLKTPRHRHPFAREHVHSGLRASVFGRAASVVVSSSRLESMPRYYHLCIGVGIAPSGSLLSRTSTDRIAKVGYLVRWVVLLTADKHACFSRSESERDILIPLHPDGLFPFTYLTVRDSRSYLTASGGARR